MKSPFKKVVFPLIVIFFITYSLAWYLFTNSLEKIINESKDYYNKYNINYRKCAKSGFPLKIQIACNGIEQNNDSLLAMNTLSKPVETKKIITTYSEPLYFGYNIISQNFYMSYKGNAVQQSVDQGFGNVIAINLSTAFGYKLSDFIKNIMKETKLSNIIEKISYIKIAINDFSINDIKTNDKIAQLKDFSTIISQEYSDISDYLYFYIKSKGESIKGKMKYSSNIFYNLLFLSDYKYDMEAKISIPKNNFSFETFSLNKFGGIEVDIKKFNQISPFVNHEDIMKLVLPKEILSNQKIILQYNGFSNVEKGFLNNFIDNYLDNLSQIYPTEKQDELQKIKEFVHTLQDPKKLGLDIDISLSLNPLDILINHFRIIADDTSIGASGKFTSDGPDADLVIISTQYKHILDFIINKYFVFFPQGLDYIKDSHDIYYNALVKTSQFFSQDANSSSEDIEFKITTDNKKFKIGNYFFTEFFENFYQILFNESMQNVKNKQSPKDEILVIMPFLKDQTTTLDNLIKNFNIQEKVN
jgi:hypothetical protein